ncbi:MAG: metal-dependent transcriptional regulator [Minisyncoccia bacterium]
MRKKARDRNYVGMDKEDYLHAIYHLSELSGAAHISDLARELGVSKPSASQMVERLARERLLVCRPYRDLALTGKGRTAARAVHERHQALAAFLTALGVPERVRSRDIHGLEHYLSPITLIKIESVTKLLQARRKRA